ncbi:3039_t:CDS:2, partial [Dentiscutata heterogama]
STGLISPVVQFISPVERTFGPEPNTGLYKVAEIFTNRTNLMV